MPNSPLATTILDTPRIAVDDILMWVIFSERHDTPIPTKGRGRSKELFLFLKQSDSPKEHTLYLMGLVLNLP